MTPLFKKLNFKHQAEILVLDHPVSFQAELDQMQEETKIATAISRVEKVEFAIAFALEQGRLDEMVTSLAPKLAGDAVIWFCYPKKSSKKYSCDFDRDTGWEKFGALGLEGVRMVAIDEDWSALRFRKVEFIKKIRRRESFALTREGKDRTTQKGK